MSYTLIEIFLFHTEAVRSVKTAATEHEMEHHTAAWFRHAPQKVIRSRAKAAAAAAGEEEE